MKESIYDYINHIKYINKKKSTFEKILASISKLDTEDLNAKKSRKHLSCITEKQLLGLTDNEYKIKGKDITENVLPGTSETLVINETLMTRKRIVNNEVIE